MKRSMMMLVFFCSLFLQHSVFARSLVFVSDIIRHGGRTTLYTLPGIHYPSLWSKRNIPSGQLTLYGIQEGMLFGQSVHVQHQSINTPAFSHSYSQQSVCVRTTGINRTLMTAQAALISAYPSIGRKLNSNAYIKFYSVPVEHDNLLLQRGLYHTAKLNRAKAWRDRWQSPMGYQLYRELLRINPNFFSNGICKKDVGLSNAKQCLKAIIPLADNVQTLDDYCNAANVCSVEKILGLSHHQQNQVMAAFAWYTIHSYLPSKTFSHYQADYQKIGLAKGSRLTSELAHNMQSVVQKSIKTTPYVLYSAHDATIIGVLSYLLSRQAKISSDSIIQSYPGFVSNIRFLLYKEDDGHYTVEIKYFNNADDAKNNRGSVILAMPFKKFYRTYFVASKYQTIYEKNSCDYKFGLS